MNLVYFSSRRKQVDNQSYFDATPFEMNATEIVTIPDPTRG